MANARGKTIDTTHLSIEQATIRGYGHRDYLSHCLRWSNVVKYLAQNQRYKNAKVLDLGCGRDVMLAKTIYSSKLIVEQYVGVDYNDPDKFDLAAFHTGRMPVYAMGNVDFAKHIQIRDFVEFDKKGPNYYVGTPEKSISPDFEAPTIVTCFEVLEHVEPGHSRAMLKKILALLQASKSAGNDPRAFISTPCYDAQVGAADNHVSEITHEALGALLEDLGFAIEARYGTFASQRQYKQDFFAEYGQAGKDIWEKLTDYYDSNLMAIMLAPMYPTKARNCLWRLMPADEKYVRRYPKLVDVPGPWTHSERWEELNSDEAYKG